MKYIVNLGQDCSTRILIDYTNLEKLPFFFDKLIVYSDDWTNIFSSEFLEQSEMKVSLFMKHTPREVYHLYSDSFKRGFGAQRRRLVFHGCIGDKYNKIYFDVRHIDDKYLEELIDMSSFEKFYLSIDEKVFPFMRKKIEENVKNTKLAYDNHTNDEILFVRSIKHLMSDIELNDLAMTKLRIKELFPNSKLLVVSDVKDNFEKDNGIVYFPFNHWKSNKHDKKEFLKLLPNW